MSNNAQWQRALFSNVVKILVGLVSIISLAVTGAVIAQWSGHGAVRSQQHHVAARSHFWQVIAGESSSSQPTVDNKLAEDIKSLLGGRDITAQRLPQKIRDFRGDTNSYGGITDAIGLDPFDERGQGGCSECGPLDSYTQKQLLRIKQGRLSQVLLSERIAGPGDYVLTPWGWGVPTSVFMLWIVGGPLVLGAAWFMLRLDSFREHPRHFSDLSWKLGEDDELGGDLCKLGTILSAPTFFVPYFGWRRANRRRFDRRVLDKFPDQVALVAETDNLIDRLALKRGDDPELAKLKGLRDDVAAEAKSQTRAAGLNHYDDDQLAEMSRRLLGSFENLRIRRDALDDMSTRKGGDRGDA